MSLIVMKSTIGKQKAQHKGHVRETCSIVLVNEPGSGCLFSSC